jgi:CRISPR-associated protein Csx1
VLKKQVGLLYILQILGRPAGYQEVNYTLDGFSYKAKLSCVALSEYFKKEEGCRIILLAPESIVTHLTDNIDEAKALLMDKRLFTELVKQRVNENRLLDRPFEVRCMQSSGFYKGSSYAVKIDNTFDNIIVDQVAQLASIDSVEELIVDISTGHNTQVLALLEAVRVLTVYNKLKHMLQDGSGLKIKIASTPPVSTPVSGEDEYPINLYEFDAKAFFEFPIKGRDAPRAADLLPHTTDELKREISVKFNWSKISKAVGEARRAFHAIKYNTPLTLFHDELIGKEEDSKECVKTLFDVVNYVEEHRRVEVDGSLLLSKRIMISRQVFTNLLLTLALHSTLTEFRSRVKRAEPTLELLHDVFTDIYEKIGLQLNARFLERDLAEYSERQEVTILSDKKRNFFAHSGLLKSYVKRTEDKKLAYKAECLDEVREWLDNPEK